ncbi:MAG: hypothetical protein WC310_00290 [Patescibacteria group bacterium]
MFEITKPIDTAADTQGELQVFSASPEGSEVDPGSISHVIGSDEVSIRSNVAFGGSISVKGRESLKLLRDALVSICKTEDIK